MNDGSKAALQPPSEDARELAESVFETVREALLVLDGSLRVLKANRAFCEHFALRKELVEGRLLDQLAEGRWSSPPLTALLHELLREREEVRNFELEHDFGALGSRLLSINARRLAQPGSTQGCILVAIEDITDRKRADEALRFRALLVDALTDAVIAVDDQSRIQIWNRGAEQLLGFSHAEALGRSSSEMLVTEGLDREGLRDALRSGRPIYIELRVRDKHGEWVECEGTSVAIKDDSGGVVSYVTIAREVGARKRLNRELRDHARALEERGRELEEANRELDGFSYSVSHDLRAPLRAIDGFSTMLLEDYGGRLDEEGRRQLAVIRRNTQRMGKLIDDLLAFSRLGRQPLNRSQVDVTRLVRAAIDESMAHDSSRAIEFCVGELPPAFGDAALLKQVFLNLLSNAIKYTRPRERARVEIQGRLDDDECVYGIEDNGVGFDMQYVGKLFGVFQRLHPVSAFEGTGVGLALVQRIVRRHGGRVWAEGERDQGAKFGFSLPRTSNEGGS